MFADAFDGGGFAEVEREQTRQIRAMLAKAEQKLYEPMEATAAAEHAEDEPARMDPWAGLRAGPLGDGPPDYAAWRERFAFLRVRGRGIGPAAAATEEEMMLEDVEEEQENAGARMVEKEEGTGGPGAAQGMQGLELLVSGGGIAALEPDASEPPVRQVALEGNDGFEEVFASHGELEEYIALEAPLRGPLPGDNDPDEGMSPEDEVFAQLVDDLAQRVLDALKGDLETLAFAVREKEGVDDRRKQNA